MTVGAAVVGTGFGCLTHVRTLRAAGFDVQALVGRDAEKTSERARRFDVPHACTSLADALALDGVDAVTIATPPHTHAAIARAAIAAGKHVLCEKPFTRDAAEARALLDAAEQAGIVHLLGAEMRFSPGQALLTKVVRDGTIGDARLATFVMHIPLLADPGAEVPDWWSDAAAGGGWLGAHAPHVIDQVRTTVGEIAGVSASLPRIVERGWTAEDSYLVFFRTVDGAAGVIESVAADRGPMLFTTRVVGTRGTAWAEGDRIQVADAEGTRAIAMPDELLVAAPEPPPPDLLVTAYDLLHSFGVDYGPYVRLCEHFLARIERRTPPPGANAATFADGVANMAVIDAIRASAATGGTFTAVASSTSTDNR
jgi:predicted dehydrogenase